MSSTASTDSMEPGQLVPGQKGIAGRVVGGATQSFALIRQSKQGMVGLFILIVFIVLAVIGHSIAPQNPAADSSFSNSLMIGPSSKHLLGTDELGRDVLSELIYGARISIVVGFSAGFMSAIIGSVVGIAAGYFGGWTDRILVLIDDWFLVIPFIPLAIVMVTLLQENPSIRSWVPGGQNGIIVLVLGITGWAGTSRIIRAQVFSVKERQFVERARSMGASNVYIMRKHILPNVLPLVLSNSVLIVALAILGEAGLSFLGLGDPTTFSWGRMLDNAFGAGAQSQNAWWYLLPPGICITLLVLAFSMVGYAIEEIVNPRLKERS